VFTAAVVATVVDCNELLVTTCVEVDDAIDTVVVGAVVGVVAARIVVARVVVARVVVVAVAELIDTEVEAILVVEVGGMAAVLVAVLVEPVDVRGVEVTESFGVEVFGAPTVGRGFVVLVGFAVDAGFGTCRKSHTFFAADTKPRTGPNVFTLQGAPLVVVLIFHELFLPNRTSACPLNRHRCPSVAQRVQFIGICFVAA
jgi:hypothetical protein